MKGINLVLPRHLALGIDGFELGWFNLAHLLHHGGRDGIKGLAGTHHQYLRDSQCERQMNREIRPLSCSRADINTPAQRSNLATHHIHADTAPGYFRYGTRR